MNMREKIARAIAGAIEDRFPGRVRQSWDDLSAPAKDAMYKRADAVLAALMEPTPGMIEAGRWPAEDDGPLACFRAMIQAAKEGE